MRMVIFILEIGKMINVKVMVNMSRRKEGVIKGNGGMIIRMEWD